MWPKASPVFFGIGGFGLMFVGFICSWHFFPKLIDRKIQDTIALKKGNEAYDMWQKQPFPLKFKVHFFNVTNPDEVQQGGRPILHEVGPYVYDEYRERFNISSDEDSDTLTYVLKKYFYFNARESKCRSEDDVVTIINAGLVGTAMKVQQEAPSMLSVINEAIPFLYEGTKDIFLRQQVKTILFGGVLVSCESEEVEFICGAMKGVLPPTMRMHPNGRDFLFSMFYHLNGTEDGPYTISRGIENKTTRGNTLTFQNKNMLDIWNGKTCNMLNGSDSSLFYPLDEIPDRIYSFSPDLCRSMYVNFEKKLTFKDVDVWKFSTRVESLQQNKENECFCPTQPDESFKNEVVNCPQDGLLDLSSCMKSPVFASYPHFYLADPALLNYTIGLKPEKHLHENFMYLEPKTATPLMGAKRLQMNVPVKQLEDFTLLNNVSEGLFPIAWIEEGVVIPDKYVDTLKSGLKSIKLLDSVKWIMVCIGILLMITSFVYILYRERLLCFGTVPISKVTISDEKPSSNPHDIGQVTDIHFNEPSVFPNLYPQMQNRDVNEVILRKLPKGINNEQWGYRN